MSATITPPLSTSARRRLPAQAHRWPATALHRWGLRLGLAVPFIVVAIVAAQRGIVSDTNRALATASDGIAWGSSNLDFVETAYPPLPTALAAIVPDNPLWTAMLGALCAGTVLQILWERLRLRNVPPALIVSLIVATAFIPPFVYASTQDLVAFLGLALFTIAVSGLIRFAVDGDTEGGFQCGLALGVAAMCDPATAVVAVCLGAAAPLIAWRRYRTSPGAITSTLFVVTFPTLAAFAGWAFLEWRFTGEAFHTLRSNPDFLAFPGGVADTVARELVALGRRLLLTPLFGVAAILIAFRRPLAALTQILVLLVILTTQTLGINYGVGQGTLLLIAMALMGIERAPGLRNRWLLTAACVAQLALHWFFVRPQTAVGDFIDQMF